MSSSRCVGSLNICRHVRRSSQIRRGSLMVREEFASWHAPLTDSCDGCVHNLGRVEEGITELASASLLGKARQWREQGNAIEHIHAWRTRYLDLLR